MLSPDTARILRHFHILLAFAVFVSAAQAKVVTEWDFTKGVLGWAPNAKVAPLKSSAEGLLVTATGDDPWIEGPAIDLPGAETTKITIRMKSTADGAGEVFYGKAFSEEK